MKPADIPRRLGRPLVRATIGTFPFFDLGLKIRGLPRLASVRRFEHREAKTIIDALGAAPSAEIVTVIPTYKRPRQLLEAIDSALAQTVDDHIVMVIDDGAGLPTLPDDPRLYAASLTRNQGTVSTTRNVGILSTRSTYSAFLDDDNTWRPDHLANALAELRRGADLTYSALERTDVHGNVIDVFSVPFDRRACREKSFADANSIVVRRDRRTLFSRAPRPFGSFPREDWEFAYRLSRRLATVHIPEPTVTYVVHDESFYTDWAGPAAT